MVATIEALGLLFIVGLNSAVAALVTRFFRVRLKTQWGSVVYTALVVPLLLIGSTMVLGSFVGPNLGGPATVLGVAVLTPFAVGVTFDYIWMPAPEDVDLPDTHDGGQAGRNP